MGELPLASCHEQSTISKTDLPTSECLGPFYNLISGGGDKNRTCYLLRAREMLSQMSYAPIILVGRDGVEPSQPQAADLQSVELTNAQPPQILAPRAGLEPATQ